MRRALQLAYVDTSAYVKRFAQEPGSRELGRRTRGVRLVSSVLLWPESMSAIARKLRDGDLTDRMASRLRSGISEDLDRILLVRTGPGVLSEAERLVFVRSLRASDAVHLGSALRVSSGRNGPLAFLTADHDLADAATQEGLAVETFGD